MTFAIAPRRAVLFLAAALMLTPALVGAQTSRSNPEVTAGATAADLLLARPGGIVATVLGTAVSWLDCP